MKKEKKQVLESASEGEYIVLETRFKEEEFKKRVKHARHKAGATGGFYFLFILIFTAITFLPLYIGGDGAMSVLNFWKPFKDIKQIKDNTVPFILSVIPSVLYGLLLLAAVINLFRALGKLGRLGKKPSRKTGANRNADAMEKLGKIYSGTFGRILIFGFLLYAFCGIGFTLYFWIAAALGIVLHFILGIAGGKVSRFNLVADKERSEVKRMRGGFAPFIRNVFQLIAVSAIVYFFLRANVVLNALNFLQKNAAKEILKNKTSLLIYGVLPLIQVLILLCTIGLFKHAVGTSEYKNAAEEYFAHKAQKGRKTFRVLSVFVLLLSVGFVVLTIVFKKDLKLNLAWSVGYIGVIALASLIEEICMRKLPNLKAKCVIYDAEVKEEKVAVATDNAAANVPADCPLENPCYGYSVPYFPITQPGVFMQPNGQPIMVLPMVEGCAVQPVPMEAVGAAENVAVEENTVENSSCVENVENGSKTSEDSSETVEESAISSESEESSESASSSESTEEETKSEAIVAPVAAKNGKKLNLSKIHAEEGDWSDLVKKWMANGQKSLDKKAAKAQAEAEAK